MYAVHGLPLVFKLPKTIAVLAKTFLLVEENLKGRHFFAFGSVDQRFRTWYNKIARDFKEKGRFGYAWLDGLGMPLGDRIYNNWATYFMVAELGNLHALGISFLLFMCGIMVLVSMQLGLLTSILYSLLILASPLVIAFFTHLGKPERIWWWLMVPFLYFAFTEYGLITGGIWSFIALVNFPLAATSALLVFPWLVYHSLRDGYFWMLVIAVLPGVIKTLVRLYAMVRSGYAQKIAMNQSGAWQRPLLPQPEELVWYIPYLLTLGCAMFESGQWLPILMGGLPPLLLYWANHRGFYLNDEQTFHFSLFLTGIILCILTQSTLGLFFTLLLAYTHPTLCTFPKPLGVWKRDRIKENITAIGKYQFERYPDLALLAYKIPDALTRFLDQIPANARICAEPDGDPRLGTQFRIFWQYLDQYFVQRGIDNIFEEYINYSEPEITWKYFIAFEALQPAQIEQFCSALGISYFITFSRKCAQVFSDISYNKIASIPGSEFEEFSALLTAPSVDLTLWKNAKAVSVIDPLVSWHIQGNQLQWYAQKGNIYHVRYRYHKNFAAYIQDKEIGITPYQPLEDLPLQFMQIQADQSGQIMLRFHPRIF